MRHYIKCRALTTVVLTLASIAIVPEQAVAGYATTSAGGTGAPSAALTEHTPWTDAYTISSLTSAMNALGREHWTRSPFAARAASGGFRRHAGAPMGFAQHAREKAHKSKR